MSDASAAATAVAVVVAALVAAPFPGIALVVLAAAATVAAAVTRRSWPLVVVLLLATGARAHGESVALARALPDRVAGIAELVGDPSVERFGVRAVLRIQGRHYVAEADTDDAGALRGALTGERLLVSGRPAAMEGAPAGWVRSRHLAGRLRLDSVGPGPPAEPWYRLANGLHRTLRAGAGGLEEQRRALYLGMVIGDDRGQDELTAFRFRASGLTHLLAVSGQNVVFVLLVAAPLLSRCGRRTRAAVSVALLVVFVLVTRADPSVLRATMMAAVSLTAVTVGRVAPSVRSLAVAVVALVAVDPLMVHSLGFRLSVAATLGVVVLAPPLWRRLPGPDVLRRPLAVSAAAQLATAPIMLSLAGGVPGAAVLTNLLAGPAAGAVMMSGMTAGLLGGALAEPVGGALVRPAEALVRWIELVAEIGSRAPVAVLDAPRLAAVTLAVVLAVAAGSGARRRHHPAAARAAGAVGVIIAVVALWPTTAAPGPSDAADGVELWAGRCGGRVAVVRDGARVDDSLDGLWRVGVRRLDVVAVERGATSRSVAAAISEQFGAREVLHVDDVTGEAPAGVSVGGVAVRLGGAGAAPVEASGAACRLRR